MKSALFLLLSSVFAVFSLIFVTPAFASFGSPQDKQTTNPSVTSGQAVSTQTQVANPVASLNTNPDVPKNLHTWTQGVLIEIMNAMTCQLAGFDPSDTHAKCLGVDQKTGKIGYVENGGGTIAVLGTMTASLYNIPIHTGDYVGYLASNFGVEKNSYAENVNTNGLAKGNHGNIKSCSDAEKNLLGIGYCGLTPLLPMWETFRNIVYLIFVLIFMIIGIAIMLRVHIDPRTVMTIENQIPKLVIGLILVTFSYAIAGFLIDMMYVVIFLVFHVLNSIPGASDAISGLTPYAVQHQSAIGIAGNIGGSNNAFGLFGTVGTIAGALSGLIARMFGIGQGLQSITGIDEIVNLFNPHIGFQLVPSLIDIFSALGAYGLMVSTASLSTTPFLKEIFSGALSVTVLPMLYLAINGFIRFVVPYGIVFFIILFALIWALFRLWFTLITAYVFLLLDVASAPFWFLLGLVPGSKLGFSAWFRDILANIAVFPVAITMLQVTNIFIQAFGCNTPNCSANTGMFVAPLIGFAPGTNIIEALIAIGIILSTPDVLRQTRAFLKAPELDLKAVGQAIGVGTGVGGVPGKIGGLGAQFYYMQHLPILGQYFKGKTPPGAPVSPPAPH